MLREWLAAMLMAVVGMVLAVGGVLPGATGGAGSPDTPVSSTPAPPGYPGPAQPTPGAPPDVDYPVVEELAPIESVDIAIAESFPPQYFVQVVSGLPSGCASFARSEVERDGDTFRITILNYMPAPDSSTYCTAIYGMIEHSIRLDGAVEAGQTYTVQVNDQTRTFIAQ